MSNRFTHKNGRIYDNGSMGDVNISYNLNADNGRLEILDFLNAREDVINDCNEEIKRLQEVIDDLHIETRNLHNTLRKQERISNNYKEIVQVLMETIGEIE